MVAGKQYRPTPTDDMPFSIAPLDQRNPHLRDDEPDPRGSAKVLVVIIFVGGIFMFIFGLWAGRQLFG